jgi:hypothetical protein
MAKKWPNAQISSKHFQKSQILATLIVCVGNANGNAFTVPFCSETIAI